MKKVFSSHEEVAHVWAQQNQEEGKAGNMFFRGPSIFSYGHHFEIARFVRHGVVLFTGRAYSVSTAKHKSITRQAIPSSFTVFTVPDMDDHTVNLQYYLAELQKFPLRIKRARSNAEILKGEMTQMICEARNYRAVFWRDLSPLLVREALDIFLKLEKQDFADIIKAQEEQAKARSDERREKLRLEKVEAMAELEKWKRGENIVRYYHAGIPTALRIVNNEVQTSNGARVPLDVALAFFKAIKAGKSVHGMKLGYYTVTSFDGETIKIGCHSIPLAEMDRLAATLKEVK